MASLTVAQEQLINMGHPREWIETLPQNAQWEEAVPPGFTSRHPTVNGHIHPATMNLDGDIYTIARIAKYIPNAADAQDIVDTMRILNCHYAILKGQTCFGTDNTSLVDSLEYCNSRGLVAKGVATVGLNVSDDELAWLKDAGTVGVRHAFLGHLADASMDKFKANVMGVADKVARYGFVTNLYFKIKHIDELTPLILEVAKRTPVTLDHMCRPDPNDPAGVDQPKFQSLMNLINEGNGNVQVLLSGPDRATESLDPAQWAKMQPFKMELATRFPSWVSVGTDFNHPNSDWGVPNDGKLWDWCRAGMSDQQWYQASYANPMKFFFGQEVPRFDPRLHGSVAVTDRNGKMTLEIS